MILKWKTRERLGQRVSKLIRGMNMSHTQLVLGNLITYEVKVDSDMLHTGVKNRIRCQVCGTKIVTVNGRGEVKH